MEPPNPPVPSPGTHARSHSSPAETDHDSEYEKEAHARKDSARTNRGSKATSGHAHDSVISPFSPKSSAPPSPGSSISSQTGRKHSAITKIQETQDRRSHHSHRVSYPQRAHLDPEKADLYDEYDHRRSLNRGLVPDAAAVVYDKSEYHEKGPEDKAWQLLVCRTSACA